MSQHPPSPQQQQRRTLTRLAEFSPRLHDRLRQLEAQERLAQREGEGVEETQNEETQNSAPLREVGERG